MLAGGLPLATTNTVTVYSPNAADFLTESIIMLAGGLPLATANSLFPKRFRLHNSYEQMFNHFRINHYAFWWTSTVFL